MINFGGSDLQGIYSGDNKIASVYHGDVKLWPTEVDFSSGYWSSDPLPTRPVPLSIGSAPDIGPSDTPTQSPRETYVQISARGDRVFQAAFSVDWVLDKQIENHWFAHAFERSGNGWNDTRSLQVISIYDGRLVTPTTYAYSGLEGTYYDGWYYRSSRAKLRIKFPQTDIPSAQFYPITWFDTCATSADGDLVVVAVQPGYTSGWVSRNPKAFALLRWSSDIGDYVFVDGSDSFGTPGHVMPEISDDGSRLFVPSSSGTNSSVNVIDINGDSYSNSATLTTSDFGLSGYSQVSEYYTITLRRLASSGDGRTVALADRGYDSLNTGRIGVMKFDGISWQQAGNVLESGLSTVGTNSDYFGESLALSHDGNCLVVGSYRAEDKGVVQVFRFVDGEWEPMGSAIRPESGGAFGRRVAISGNGLVVSVLSANAPIYGEIPRVNTFHWNGSDWSSAGDPIFNPNGFNYATQTFVPPGISLSRDGSALAVGWEWTHGFPQAKGCTVYNWNSTGAAT